MPIAIARIKNERFRRLWIARINAAARLNGISYSKLMHELSKSEIQLNRKVLADLAMNHPDTFQKSIRKYQKIKYFQ